MSKIKLLESNVGINQWFLKYHAKTKGKNIQEQLNWNAEIVCFDEYYQESGKTAQRIRENIDIVWQEAYVRIHEELSQFKTKVNNSTLKWTMVWIDISTKRYINRQ